MDEQSNAARATGDGREAEILAELLRLIRLDAEIMKSVRDMVRAAGQEAARRPGVILQSPSAASHEGELIGSQFGGTSILGQLLELVKEEKPFIRDLIIRILRL